MTAIHVALCRLHSANQPMLPIPVDADIYYRLLRAVYWRPCAHLPMGTLMRPLPLLFAVCPCSSMPTNMWCSPATAGSAHGLQPCSTHPF